MDLEADERHTLKKRVGMHTELHAGGDEAKFKTYEELRQENAALKKEKENLWAVIRGMKKDIDLEADERHTLKKRVEELQKVEENACFHVTKRLQAEEKLKSAESDITFLRKRVGELEKLCQLDMVKAMQIRAEQAEKRVGKLETQQRQLEEHHDWVVDLWQKEKERAEQAEARVKELTHPDTEGRGAPG